MDKPSCCVESLSWLAELFIRLCLAAGVGIANSDVMPTFVRIGFYSEIPSYYVGQLVYTHS